ncbi:RluA family pseudouridine synthase [Enterobacteriaceae bacterium ET-AT1-13]|nr:RluA family pseudouridine synthase [Enterobacteriaceae bacterium ET-AT1-13]WGS66369.1 RluA family pseudouridine synthase [Enterobacteriaceae bacterium Cmel17]WMC17394.1 MAG: RluA family pseudouridine synthase [Enterobacteriaceae bacterium Cmel21]WMC17600.1 MAG: RluA family pseudouridine synthase [Enterobacteriaceae bacterium PSmelAO3-2]WMC17805.1 MAG: RluA family pseudouridine synthase [Enterobacteriaceae bacterium PSmelAO3-1]WMC18008.1 MAG: RluA family pseudouridine synthase [Enterobacteri
MIIKYIILQSNNYIIKKRLDKILSNNLLKYSRSYIKNLIINNKVKTNYKLLNKPNKKIFKKTLIKIIFKKKKKTIKYQKIKLNILYEDKYLIIINKPKNFVVHPGYKNLKNTLINALIYYNNFLILIKRLGIIHRLDKDTSGLIIITKTLLTRKLIINSLKYHKIKKEYKGIVNGNIINNGYINAKISRNIRNRIKMDINKKGKKAITYYKIDKKFNNYTKLKILIKTGKTHQIRIHMSYINHPLIGDKKYNKIKKKKNSIKFNRQALHSYFLNFYHPIYGFILNCYSQIPLDILNLIKIIN